MTSSEGATLVARNAPIDPHQHHGHRDDAAEFVRQIAAEHAHAAAQEDRAGRVIFRLRLVDAELVVEEGRQVGRQPRKPPKVMM